ncbi:hypothetical protein PG999_007363 [Apiospora kogelbergensis]|uniref:Uncharacterized protein n=1 Tax=Apiospora kogelbergensis TaxID=1337665 RepID=A0AAW0QY29_9PEZI
MRSISPFLLSFALYSSLASAYTVRFYASLKKQGPPDKPSYGCGGNGASPKEFKDIKPGDCQVAPDPGWQPICMKVEGEAKDAGLQVVWFSSDDCNPANHMGNGDDREMGHNVQGFKSWQVWDLMEEDSESFWFPQLCRDTC